MPSSSWKTGRYASMTLAAAKREAARVPGNHEAAARVPGNHEGDAVWIISNNLVPEGSSSGGLNEHLGTRSAPPPSVRRCALPSGQLSSCSRSHAARGLPSRRFQGSRFRGALVHSRRRAGAARPRRASLAIPGLLRAGKCRPCRRAWDMPQAPATAWRGGPTSSRMALVSVAAAKYTSTSDDELPVLPYLAS